MPEDIIDWDDMSEEDKEQAQKLLTELNQLFDKYTKEEDPCEDSILDD
jgi:hypothetical protein